MKNPSVVPAWRCLPILALLLMLGACSSLPNGSDESATADTESSGVAAQADDGAAPAFVFEGPEQNPYLTQAADAPSAARKLFQQAIEAMAEQQWQEAELLLKQLTAEYPDLSGPFVNLGIVYRQTQREEEAEEAFTAAIAANSLNLEAYNQLAYLKREQGDFSAAEENYLKALEVWPRHAQSHKNIGILYDLYMGEWDKALEHYQKYQFLVGDEDKLIAGWIIDLQRRM